MVQKEITAIHDKLQDMDITLKHDLRDTLRQHTGDIRRDLTTIEKQIATSEKNLETQEGDSNAGRRPQRGHADSNEQIDQLLNASLYIRESFCFQILDIFSCRAPDALAFRRQCSFPTAQVLPRGGSNGRTTANQGNDGHTGGANYSRKSDDELRMDEDRDSTT
jgi:hypothetical protein